MADFGVTEMASNDLVLGIVQESMRESVRLLPTVKSFEAPKGAQSVRVPRHDQFTAENKGENSALTSQALTFSYDEITLNKQRSVLSRVEDIASIQSGPDVNSAIVSDMGKELGKAVDAAIISELKSASASPDHTLTYAGSSVAALADILNARKLLRDQYVDFARGDLWMAIAPDIESDILAISNFVDASKYGELVAASGHIGNIMGFNVIVNADLTDGDALFYSSDACGVAFSQRPSFETSRDLPNVASEYLASVIFGARVLAECKKCVHYTYA